LNNRHSNVQGTGPSIYYIDTCVRLCPELCPVVADCVQTVSEIVSNCVQDTTKMTKTGINCVRLCPV
jgi:hypothetical protein